MACIPWTLIAWCSPHRVFAFYWPVGSMRPYGAKALVCRDYTFGTGFSPPAPLHFVRCGVSCCSAVRDLRRLPPPSLGVSSLDLGRLLASGPFSCRFAKCLSDGQAQRCLHGRRGYSAPAR